MNEIGIFEAKMKFSELCDRVASKKQAVIVTKRGRALVRIEPVENTSTKTGILDRMKAFEKKYGKSNENFVVPKRTPGSFKSPF
jgi:prevent-host-death family protein